MKIFDYELFEAAELKRINANGKRLYLTETGESGEQELAQQKLTESPLKHLGLVLRFTTSQKNIL